MRVAVIGGGITGLVAARDLAAAGADVILFESDARLGGKIKTLEVGGVQVEAGPDWFLTRNPAALELSRELGLAHELVAPGRNGACIFTGARLVELPEAQVRGVPLRPFEAARAGLIPRTAALRALLDLVIPGRVTGPDTSVGNLIRRRMGAQVLDRMVDPMLAASRAGRARDLSLEATAPEIDAAARSGPSLIRGLRTKRKEQAREPPPETPPFLGIRTGMESLVRALTRDLGAVDVRTSEPVEGVERNGFGYRIGAPAPVDADAVILAIPAYAAARLVRAGSVRAADLLATIHYASAAVATLVYPPGAVEAHPDAGGFLVPTSEGRAVTAGAWYSVKWPHSDPGDGSLVVRCFAGRAHDDPVLNVDAVGDDALAERMTREVGDIVGAVAAPSEVHLTRWREALPQYEVGHNQRVAAIERFLEADLPRVLVAGAGYRGSGLPDCITQAHDIAQRLTQRAG